MARPLDKGVIGRRFGIIKVLSHVSAVPGEEGHYLCRCDCGVVVKVFGADRLIDGKRMSCGCSRPRKRKDFPKIKPGEDVTGERYGMLVARKRAITAGGQGAVWLFKCDCGTGILIRLKDVKSGNTASCGCVQYKKGAGDVVRPWAKSCMHEGLAQSVS